MFRVYAWAKAIRGPEDSPEVWAISVMGMLLALNVVAIFFIYYRISGRGIPWLLKAAPAVGAVGVPCCIAYGIYFLGRLPKIQAEFEDPDEPVIGGPGMVFVVYTVTSIALFVVAIALITPR